MANNLRTEDLQVLLDEYTDKMEDLSEHVFFDQWQHHQFKLLLENIEKGTIVFVHDFAKNMLLRYQKEPQNHFWDHTQVTLHTTVAYYKCDCGCLITEYIYHVTSDKSHDWKAVDHFTRLSIEHLNLLIRHQPTTRVAPSSTTYPNLIFLYVNTTLAQDIESYLLIMDLEYLNNGTQGKCLLETSQFKMPLT